MDARDHLDGVAQAALQQFDRVVCLGQEEEPVGPLRVEVLEEGPDLRDLEDFARVVVVSVDHQADPTAVVEGCPRVCRQAPQEFKGLTDVADVYLLAGEHQKHGLGNARTEPLGHAGSTSNGASVRDELTARLTG
jgi:hypothetical protein